MPLDLSNIYEVVGDLMMTDECVITRDEELTGDDVWNDETGTYTRPDPDEVTIYAGSCHVWSQNVQPRGETQGGVLQVEMWYFLAIPIDETAQIIPEDFVTIIESVNPNLNGRIMRVAGETLGTYDVHRTFRLNEYSRIPGA